MSNKYKFIYKLPVIFFLDIYIYILMYIHFYSHKTQKTHSLFNDALVVVLETAGMENAGRNSLVVFSQQRSRNIPLAAKGILRVDECVVAGFSCT